MQGLNPALSASLGVSPDMMMVWFGTIVAETLHTAYLSPPVAMSAYYHKQVVKECSLLTIYRGMFEFMGLQVIAISLLVMFPAIAVWLPEKLQEISRAIVTEEVEGGATLEDYQVDGGYGSQLREALEGEQEEAQEEAQEGQEEEESAGDSLEEDELSNTKK